MCKNLNELFVINLGYMKLKSKDFDIVVNGVRCPCCMTDDLEIWNLGFVNAKWIIWGVLKKNPLTKIVTDGQTYDSKLHTFKEMNYKTAWKILEIEVEQI